MKRLLALSETGPVHNIRQNDAQKQMLKSYLLVPSISSVLNGIIVIIANFAFAYMLIPRTIYIRIESNSFTTMQYANSAIPIFLSTRDPY